MNPRDHLLGSFRRGEGLMLISSRARSGGSCNSGGSPSAISSAVMPMLHTSTWCPSQRSVGRAETNAADRLEIRIQARQAQAQKALHIYQRCEYRRTVHFFATAATSTARQREKSGQLLLSITPDGVRSRKSTTRACIFTPLSSPLFLVLHSTGTCISV